MSNIFYVCVKNGAHSPTTANRGPVSADVLSVVDRLCGEGGGGEAAPAASAKRSYTSRDTTFNYVTGDGLLVLCVADATTPRRVCFAFIERVRAECVVRKGIDRSFLKSEMEFFSTNPEADKIRRVQAQVDDVKEVMLDNLDKILTRGEKLEDIDRKTDDLRDQSNLFNRQAKKLKCALIQQNMKLTIVIVALIIFILVVLAIVIYLVVDKFT